MVCRFDHSHTIKGERILVSMTDLLCCTSTGFLSQLPQSRPIETCVRCGIWAATEVIQQDGCILPVDLEIPDEFKILN